MEERSEMEVNAAGPSPGNQDKSLTKRGLPRRSPRGNVKKILKQSKPRDQNGDNRIEVDSRTELRGPSPRNKSTEDTGIPASSSPSESRTATDIVDGPGSVTNIQTPTTSMPATRTASYGEEVEDRELPSSTPSCSDGTPYGLSSEDVAHPETEINVGRSRLSRRRVSRNDTTRRNVHAIENRNEPRQIPPTATSAPEAEHDIQLSFNRVKLELSEGLRDKKAYSSALLSVKEQKDGLEKEVHRLRQQNTALESAMNVSSRLKNGKKAVWSMGNLRDTNIATYQVICLAAGDLARTKAKLVTTETYFDEKMNSMQKRNWTGSATVVSSTKAKEAIQDVVLPNGSLAIPTSCMERASSHDHYLFPYDNEKGFARYCVKKILSSPVGSMMSEDDKNECETLVLAHRERIGKFKAVLSDSVGNRKKVSLGVFLRTLGYLN